MEIGFIGIKMLNSLLSNFRGVFSNSLVMNKMGFNLKWFYEV
jgi:hypothetical protein